MIQINFLHLLGLGAVGLLTAFFAYRRGQNPYLWFFAGFCFGMLGIVAIFFAPWAKKKPAPVKLPPQPYIHGPVDKFWYFLDETHKQQGPFSYQGMTNEWKKGEVRPSTLVWHEELAEWKKLEEIIRVK
jgi:hypothetical protein